MDSPEEKEKPSTKPGIVEKIIEPIDASEPEIEAERISIVRFA